MRRKELERRLSMVPAHPAPSAALEQYGTTALVAADLLYEALVQGDIADRVVVDLGCGTGILAIGAKLLGAREAIGIDTDATAIAVAHSAAGGLGVTVDFIVGDIGELHERVDCVVMNPPFGSQRRHADRPFIETALRLAPVVYSLHNGATLPFLQSMAKALKTELTVVGRLTLPLPRQFPHHRKAVVEQAVVLLRWRRDARNGPLVAAGVAGSRSEDV